MRGFHVNEPDVPVEQWAERGGSVLTWRTLVGHGRVPSAGLSAGIAELAPGGGRLERHRHAPPEVYHVLAGTGVVTVDDERFEVAPGSTVYIPGRAWHAIGNSGHGALRLFYCFPSDRFADVVYEYASDSHATG